MASRESRDFSRNSGGTALSFGQSPRGSSGTSARASFLFRKDAPHRRLGGFFFAESARNAGTYRRTEPKNRNYPFTPLFMEMKDLVELAKARGFVYQGSEIYGGLANAWDYGPLGAQLKENIKNAWIKTFVQKRTDMVLLDAAILMNPQVWVASGHVGGFSDPLMECKECHTPPSRGQARGRSS
jgi:hypothetical protein